MAATKYEVALLARVDNMDSLVTEATLSVRVLVTAERPLTHEQIVAAALELAPQLAKWSRT